MPRILVVEDEPGIALGLEDSLRLDGYDVDVIGKGLVAQFASEHGGAVAAGEGSGQDWTGC